MTKLLALLLSLTFFFLPVNGMQIDRVILSSNDNVNYIEFWPVVAPIWKAMGIRPTLALVGNAKVDESLGDVVRFTVIPGVEGSLQAQTVRLLVPILFPNEVCMISDIDMLPVSKDYFTKSAIDCPNDAFVIFRDRAYDGWGWKSYPMCYFAAQGSTFSKVFGASRYEDINVIIKQWSDLKMGWGTDESLLYLYANSYGENGGKLIKLGHQVGPRFDRANWVIENLDISRYIDAHCPRPYSGYKFQIDPVVQAIMHNLKNHN